MLFQRRLSSVTYTVMSILLATMICIAGLSTVAPAAHAVTLPAKVVSAAAGPTKTRIASTVPTTNCGLPTADYLGETLTVCIVGGPQGATIMVTGLQTTFWPNGYGISYSIFDKNNLGQPPLSAAPACTVPGCQVFIPLSTASEYGGSIGYLPSQLGQPTPPRFNFDILAGGQVAPPPPTASISVVGQSVTIDVFNAMNAPTARVFPLDGSPEIDAQPAAFTQTNGVWEAKPNEGPHPLIPAGPDDWYSAQVIADGQTVNPTVTGTVNPAQRDFFCVYVTVCKTGPGQASQGYWLVAKDGGIFTFGEANFFGSTGAVHLAKPIVGMTRTPDSGGYWFVASDGGVFAFGDAGFFGSLGNIHLNAPIVGMAATPSGKGYWLVASDGGIFAFGDAGFFGSTGAVHLAKPIVGMTVAPNGQGYWLVASDGGIFAFNTTFLGSTGAVRLTQPIVGMATTPTGRGYWLVASDGGIFTFGDAGFYGSTGAVRLAKPIVGMAATPTGAGYRFVASDGGIFTFGDADFLGSTGAVRLNQPIVGMASA